MSDIDRLYQRLIREKRTPEQKRRQVEYATQWAADNPDKRKVHQHAYYERHKLLIRERQLARYHANRDVMVARQAAYRAKRKAVAA